MTFPQRGYYICVRIRSSSPATFPFPIWIFSYSLAYELHMNRLVGMVL